MHMAKGTIVSVFTVLSVCLCHVPMSGSNLCSHTEEAGVDLGGGDHIYIYIYIYICYMCVCLCVCVYVYVYIYIYIYEASRVIPAQESALAGQIGS